MKNRLSLSEWASLAEVVGTLGVLVSLVYLVIGINKSTAEASADSTQAFYTSVLDVEMAVAADERWSQIVVAGRKPGSGLTEVEQFRYDAYLTSMVDVWDGLQARFDDGLMEENNLRSWDIYFGNWAKRHVSLGDWERIRWQYEDGMVPKLEAAIGFEAEKFRAAN